jgi:serine/threonine protein kinase
VWGFYEDYKPIEKIGKGGTASVFLALRRKDNEKVAIKAFFKN